MRATPTQELLRLGFTDAGRAQQLLADPVLADVVARAEEAGASLPAALARTPDPDLALLTLLRLVEAAADDLTAAIFASLSRREPDPAPIPVESWITPGPRTAGRSSVAAGGGGRRRRRRRSRA